MDALLFHPQVVHIPVALGILMPLIAAGLLLAWWRSWLPGRVFYVAVALQAVLVAGALTAQNTGAAQEEAVESVVAKQHIEAHEESAELFVWTSAVVLGLMMLGAAYSRRRSPGLYYAAAATVGTLAVLAVGYQTGKAGGELVYTHGAAQVYVDKHAPPHEQGPQAPVLRDERVGLELGDRAGGTSAGGTSAGGTSINK